MITPHPDSPSASSPSSPSSSSSSSSSSSIPSSPSRRHRPATTASPQPSPLAPTIRIFATVGTTRFDSLVSHLVSRRFLSQIVRLRRPHSSSSAQPATVHLTIQYGKSSIADILASSTLAAIDDGSQLVPEPGLRVINGRRVYQNRLKHVAALDPGQTGTLSGLRIRQTQRTAHQLREAQPTDMGAVDALDQAILAATAGGSSQDPAQDALGSSTLEATTTDGVELQLFQYAPSLDEYIRQSDVVISHAGAGTIIETLRLPGKPPALIVVANASLMDNHQAELADALGREGYLVVGKEDQLADQIQQALLERETDRIRPFPAFEPARFQQLVDEVMGFPT
ncbi:N-acetylglucosaminyldiphosphodolichol N-acetylglucosaminyltransferase catalytic subunit alg13 [Thecaphora frezii]